MLSFAAEFPVASECHAQNFLDVVKKWLLESPHCRLLPSDLDKFLCTGRYSVNRNGQSIDLIGVSGQDQEECSIVVELDEGDLFWRTEVVFSRDSNDCWVGVRIFRESSSPTAKLPDARKPVIVAALLNALGGGADGEFTVQYEPHLLPSSNIISAARIVTGEIGCYLPIVYVSARFSEGYIVDLSALASDLAGMAHVVVEPNRAFSNRLKIEVSSQNVYGGTIGVYWPDGSGRRIFFAAGKYDSALAIKRAISDEIRAALLNRRPLTRCTWLSVQEKFSQDTYIKLKSSGSAELDDYVAAFDLELKSKSKQIESAEQEISRLKREVLRYEANSADLNSITISVGTEQDYYEGEVRDIVLQALKEAIDRCHNGSRRQHVIEGIVNNNNMSDKSDSMRAQLKEIMRDYRSMDNVTKRKLEQIGFSIVDENKQYKLIFNSDPRYTFILARTGSDSRGGLNMFSDMSKTIF